MYNICQNIINIMQMNWNISAVTGMIDMFGDRYTIMYNIISRLRTFSIKQKRALDTQNLSCAYPIY